MRSPAANFCYSLLVLAWPLLVSTAPSSQDMNLQRVVSTIYRFPRPIWLENLAVRSNNQILTTSLTTGALYQIAPHSAADVAPAVVATFPGKNGALGLAEYEEDVFAVAAGEISATDGSATPGSFAIFKVDMRAFHAFPNGTVLTPADVSLIADVPSAAVVNGVALLDSQRPALLLADSLLGVVFELDIRSGKSVELLNSTLLRPTATGIPRSGVNGIKVRDGYAYFTNSAQQLFGRFSVSPRSGGSGAASHGPIEILNEGILGDDFIFSAAGDAYITTDPQNTLTVRTADNRTAIIAGNQESTLLEGDTACAWDRTRPEGVGGRLYVSTNGGLVLPINGTEVVNGAILAVDIIFKS